MRHSRRLPSALAAAGLVLLSPAAAMAATDPQPDRGNDSAHGHQGQPDEHADEHATTAPNGSGGAGAAHGNGSAGGHEGHGGGAPEGNAGGGPAGEDNGENNGNKNDRQTICHATNADTNPYVMITPNKNGVLNGHAKDDAGPLWGPTLKDAHTKWGDIIPPFDYNDHGTTRHFDGQNWTAEGQSWFANGCEAPAQGGGETTTGGTTTTGGGTGAGSGGGTTTTGGFTGGGGGVMVPGGTTLPPADTVQVPTAIRGTTAGGGTALPFTGGELALAAGVAALGLVTGTGFVVAGRRRAAES